MRVFRAILNGLSTQRNNKTRYQECYKWKIVIDLQLK